MASMAYISNSESWPENGLVGSSPGLGCRCIPKKCQGKMIELPNCSREIHFTMLRLEVQEASCPMESYDFHQKIKKFNKNLFHEIARPISIGFSDFLEKKHGVCGPLLSGFCSAEGLEHAVQALHWRARHSIFLVTQTGSTRIQQVHFIDSPV